MTNHMYIKQVPPFSEQETPEFDAQCSECKRPTYLTLLPTVNGLDACSGMRGQTAPGMDDSSVFGSLTVTCLM